MRTFPTVSVHERLVSLIPFRPTHWNRMSAATAPLSPLVIMATARRRSVLAIGVALAVTLCGSALHGAGGTMTVARPGEPAAINPNWPEGVAALVNDAARTHGWHGWFSGWPSDVNHYGYQIATMDDVNHLVEKLAAVKAPLRLIRLSPLKEPGSLGWVTRLAKGNRVAVVFSVGDQERVNDWYKHLRQPFGVMEFQAVPVAVPPTLTIFVQNDTSDLDQLKVPAGISVEAGYVPTLFYRSHTKAEKQREEKAGATPQAVQGLFDKEVDPVSRAAAEKIDGFLKQHNACNTEE
jgi:hypothetical protein